MSDLRLLFEVLLLRIQEYVCYNKNHDSKIDTILQHQHI